MFVKCLAYGQKLNPDSIFILSAEHHLLDLDTEIEPYNRTLNKMSKKYNSLSLSDKNTIAFQVVILLQRVKTVLETIKSHKNFKYKNSTKI